MKEVWELPDYDLDTRVADDLVKRLRRKFREAGCRAAIETVWAMDSGWRKTGGRGHDVCHSFTHLCSCGNPDCAVSGPFLGAVSSASGWYVKRISSQSLEHLMESVQSMAEEVYPAGWGRNSDQG